MALEFTDEERERYFSVMAAGGIADMDEISLDAHVAVLTLARQDDKVFRALRELMSAARGSGYREACMHLTRRRNAPHYDGTTVSTDEVAKAAISIEAIGVRWGPGEAMCLSHAMAYARRQAAKGLSERGALIYDPDQFHCFACRTDDGPDAG